MKTKQKTCKVCKEKYTPISSLSVACSPKCAMQWANKKKEMKEKRERSLQLKVDRERFEQLKTLPMLIQECQKVFNKYIRLRDAGKPCISCGAYNSGIANTVDAGHYRAVGGAPNVRFDENNVHSQCKKCNMFSFDSSAYRKELINRIGIDAVEILEADNKPRHYSRDDIREKIKYYKEKIKNM